MAEKSGFFDSLGGDRRYSASFIADFYAQVLTNGIYNGGTNLMVSNTNNNMVSNIATGRAFINGYFYNNDAVISLTHNTAHALLDRIDRIVLRLDTNEAERSIKARIVEGMPSDTPVAPNITRDGSIYEISLAQVLIPYGSSVIPSINISDERLNVEVCGLINSLVTVDTEVMQQQFDDFMATIENASYITHDELDPEELTAQLADKAKKPTNESTATTGQVLSSDGAGTSSFKAPTITSIEGSYIGNNVVNRTITIGFTPKIVILTWTDHFGISLGASATFGIATNSGLQMSADQKLIPVITANGFTVSVHTTPSNLHTNYTGLTYTYKAIA